MPSCDGQNLAEKWDTRHEEMYAHKAWNRELEANESVLWEPGKKVFRKTKGDYEG